MKTINFKKEISCSMDDAVIRTTVALKDGGFGVLTRIDFHTKIKEKLGKDILPVVILGACNPKLALEAYEQNSDVTSLLPCNVVLREISKEKISVEVAKPTALMEILGDSELVELARNADSQLANILEAI
jgi:uncharacterized protein (DUF302 family)